MTLISPVGTTTPIPSVHLNNPSKEILASSGIYDKKLYSSHVYAPNFPNNTVQNTGVATTTIDPNIPTIYAPHSNHIFHIQSLNLNLSTSDSDTIDDMYIINPYIPY